MIHEIVIENFYSFRNENKISFVVNQLSPDTDSYVTTQTNTKLTKVLMAIGHNASGKTNLLKAFSFLKWFIVNSFSLMPEDEIRFLPFKFRDESDITPSSLMVIFELNKKIFTYKINLIRSRILFEELNMKEFGRNTKTLFLRKWNEAKKEYEYDFEKFLLPKEYAEVIQARKNASMLSSAFQIKHELSEEIVTYWNNIETNVYEMGKDEESVLKVAKFYSMNKDILGLASELLSRFDLGLSDVLIEEFKDSENDKMRHFPFGIHMIDNHKFSLPMLYESSGTNALFKILKTILAVLKNGGIAVLDEFDADLHPDMLPELLKLFTSKVHNKKNAQLIFSTHHYEMMNKLDKYQMLLTEKNDDGSTEVWRLDDMKGIRSDDNYYAKYMAGAYGAKPNI